MASYQVRQSSTSYPLVFLLVSSSDHIAPVTGASPTVVVSKSGGAFAAPAGTVSEVGNGWYKVAGNATDTSTLGPLALHATAAGADPCDSLFEVVAVDPQDPTAFGLARLDAAVSSRLASLGTNAPANWLNAAAVAAGSLNGKGDWLTAGAYSAPPSAATIAAAILVTPANKLATSAAGKAAATLDAADVVGNLPANAIQFAGQTVTASASVTLPASVASQTAAPSWYLSPADPAVTAQAVWDLPQSSIGLGATQGQLLASIAAYPDPWTAKASTVLSPAPTATGFRVDPLTVKGAVAVPCTCAVMSDSLRGAIVRVASYDPGTGDVVLLDPLPAAPPSDATCVVEFGGSVPGRIDLAQPIADAKTATVGGALAGSWAVAWGKTVRDRVAKLLKVWGPTNAGATPSATFALDDPDAPTSRTPS